MNQWSQSTIRSVQDGDEQAYRLLLSQAASALRGYFRKRLSATGDVEDIVQETLIGLHHSFHTYNTARPFGPWLFAIAGYKLKDHLRKQYRRTEMESGDIEQAMLTTAAADVTASREAHEYVRSGLEILPARQRHIIQRMKIEGYSAQEVAKEMEMSVSAVKVSAHRGLKEMKKYLTRMDES